MFEFEWLFMLFLLPLPALFYLLKNTDKTYGLAIRLPFFTYLKQNPNFSQKTARFGSQQILFWLAWVFLLLSVAKPIWIDEIVKLPIKGRDIMLSIDLSGSMAKTDFRINGKRTNRLAVVKKAALGFVDRRKNDRIGLVVFGTKAFLYSPLTFDKNIIKQYLHHAQINMAGRNTAIGDSIIVAIEHFQNNQQEDKPRALILLTDGEDSQLEGSVSVEKATQVAKGQNIKIYTIGLDPGRGVGIDENTLKYIAKQTGGLYFRAQNTKRLSKIYTEIDTLEKDSQEKLSYQVHKDLFFYPLSMFLFLLILLMLGRRL